MKTKMDGCENDFHSLYYMTGVHKTKKRLEDFEIIPLLLLKSLKKAWKIQAWRIAHDILPCCLGQWFGHQWCENAYSSLNQQTGSFRFLTKDLWWTHTTLACQTVWQCADGSRCTPLSWISRWMVSVHWHSTQPKGSFTLCSALYPPATHFDPLWYPFCLCSSLRFMQSVDGENRTPWVCTQSLKDLHTELRDCTVCAWKLDNLSNDKLSKGPCVKLDPPSLVTLFKMQTMWQCRECTCVFNIQNGICVEKMCDFKWWDWFCLRSCYCYQISWKEQSPLNITTLSAGLKTIYPYWNI